MTIDQRIERALPEILAELGAGPAPDYVDRILTRTSRAAQRPSWVFPGRWLAVGAALRSVPGWALPSRRWANVAVVVLLVLALVAAAVYVGSHWKRLPLPFGPASNGVIVYASLGDIYAFDPVTHTSEAIVAGPTHDHSPFFAPNGTRVAFLRRTDADTDGATDIVVARADGTDPVVITTTPLLEAPWAAAWTPDSESIAVITTERLDGSLQLFNASRAQAPRRIDPGAGMTVGSVSFQPPDGRRILFRGQSLFDIGLYVMGLDGSNRTTLLPPFTTDHSHDSNLPRSNWQDPNAVISDIWSYNPTALAELRNTTWSPDGRRVAFSRYVADGSMRLFLINADGTGLQEIAYTTGDTRDAYPVWSPDGTRIAFLRYRHIEDAWSYAVVRLADGQVTPTGPGVPRGLAGISWSPDGKILLAVEHSGDQRVILLDPAGGVPQYLSLNAEIPGWWEEGSVTNATDFGSWQRKASP